MQQYKVTEELVLSHIQSHKFIYDEQLTICIITTTNGDKVVGHSVEYDITQYNQLNQMQRAYNNALNELKTRCEFLVRTLNNG